MGLRCGLPDLVKFHPDLCLNALRHLVQHLSHLVDPAALLAFPGSSREVHPIAVTPSVSASVRF